MPLKLAEHVTIKHKIAIASGKGGVGKSSITVNLARALKAQGFSVGILDADIYGPSLKQMLPETLPAKQEGEAIYPAESEGIKLMSMAYFRKKSEAAAIRAPIANGIISQLIKDVLWGSLDFLLIDFPPGTGDIQLTLAQKAFLSSAIMVTTPQEVALLDVRKALHLFELVKVPILGIVENMSYYFHPPTEEKIPIFGEGGGERLAKEYNLSFLGAIPLDPELCRGGDQGTGLASALTKQAFSQLAEKVHRFGAAPHVIKAKLSDPHTLAVEWEKGLISYYKLSDLQKKCPCASCQNEGLVQDNLSAAKVEPAGSYAFKIHFNTGCSHGIYSFDSLKNL